MTKFSLEDRVLRHTDFETRSGKIVNIYGQRPYGTPSWQSEINEDETVWRYPELYSVLFDDGSFETGFLPHGLQREDK